MTPKPRTKPPSSGSVTLYEAVASYGWRLEVRPSLMGRGGLGEYFPDMGARAFEGCVVAVLPGHDDWDNAYNVSHEIAETWHKFEHTATMFADQANILARWHRLRCARPEPVRGLDWE